MDQYAARLALARGNLGADGHDYIDAGHHFGRSVKRRQIVAHTLP